MQLQDIISPEFLLCAAAIIGFGMAAIDPREERNRQREEERLRRAAEQEQRRLEAEALRQERLAEREANRNASKEAQEARRLAEQEIRNANRIAAQEARMAQQEAMRLKREGERELRAGSAEVRNSFGGNDTFGDDYQDHKSRSFDRADGAEYRNSSHNLFDNPTYDENLAEKGSGDFITSSGFDNESFGSFDHADDQGIMSDLQGANIDRAVFSAERIDHQHPDESLVLHEFDLGSALKARLFFDQSMYNRRLSLGDPDFAPERAAILQVRYLVDGNESAVFYDTISNHDQLRTWTTWWYGLLPDSPQPWNYSMDVYFHHFGKVVEGLHAGHHDFRIEWWMLPDNQSHEGHLICEGDLSLHFDDHQYAQWVSRFGQRQATQTYANGQATQEAPTHIRVTVRNECRTGIQYQVESGGSTVNSSLGSNNFTTVELKVGARILVNGSPVFTASAGADGQTVMLCR